MEDTINRVKPRSKFSVYIDRFFVTVFVILGLVILYKVIDFSAFKGEIRAYSALCNVPAQYNKCSSPAFASGITIYKPMVNLQQVIFNDNDTGWQKVTKCAIKDRTNWSCSYDDNSATFGFNNGVYFDYDNTSMESPAVAYEISKTYYVSHWDWTKLECKGQSWHALCLLLEY